MQRQRIKISDQTAIREEVNTIQNAEIEEVTLGKFINENDKLIAVLGIFFGVTAFSPSAAVKPVGQFIVFFLFGAAMLVWSELFSIYRNSYPAARRLQVFMLALFGGFLASILYWLLEFGIIRKYMLVTILMRVIYDLTLFQKVQKISNTILRNAIFFLLFTLCMLLSIPLNTALDKAHDYFASIQQAEQKRGQ